MSGFICGDDSCQEISRMKLRNESDIILFKRYIRIKRMLTISENKIDKI